MLTIVTSVAVRRLLLLFVAGVDQAHAQEAGTDDILCTDGSEVPGRVLTISPLALRYLPPAGTDTLRLATADVLLVRYAKRHPRGAVPSNFDQKAASTRLVPGPERCPAPHQGPPGYGSRLHYQRPVWGSLGATLYRGHFWA